MFRQIPVFRHPDFISKKIPANAKYSTRTIGRVCKIKKNSNVSS